MNASTTVARNSMHPPGVRNASSLRCRTHRATVAALNRNSAATLADARKLEVVVSLESWVTSTTSTRTRSS